MAQRILIVDDYDDARAILSAFFESAGYDVQTASDGPGALAATTQFPPSLILMDIFMPQIDGIETTQRIKRIADAAGIPVIAYTGKPTEQLDDELFAGICVKSCPPDVLLGMVKDALAGRRGMTYYGASPRHAGSTVAGT